MILPSSPHRNNCTGGMLRRTPGHECAATNNRVWVYRLQMAFIAGNVLQLRQNMRVDYGSINEISEMK